MAVVGSTLTPGGTATATTTASTTSTASATTAASTASTSQTLRHARIDWHACPDYSDDVLDWIGFPDHAWFKAAMNRADCGTLDVPLDYADPSGRWISVALTRLPATDKAHRLGSLALNPGGPGGSGYLMPFRFAQPDRPTADLNKQYDLIGFDPRGVGSSTTVDCAEDGVGAPPTITEAEARRVYAQLVRVNQECASTDPEFIGQLTTQNIARDLDRIRTGLGERRLSYYGVSWGSWLGPVYRNLFPSKVGRMWVDSVAPPDPRLDTFVAERAAATERDFSRMATWMARFDDTYGFGTTGSQVKASLTALQRDLDAHPKEFTGIPVVFDGSVVALAGSQPSPVWPQAAQVFAELRDATGPIAPPEVAEVFGGEPMEPPAGLPARSNPTANQAIFCNGDGGARDFESAWDAYQERLRRLPITGRLSSFLPPCAGWPLPVQEVRLRFNRAPLVLSGHRYESVSVYRWTHDMKAAVGGTTFTVEDDVHGSVIDAPDCAAHVVAYFRTGKPGASGCQGVPVPTGPDAGPPAGPQVAQAGRSMTLTPGWSVERLPFD
ncbi:alpha/beta hydrolase [Actinopolymorpha pittospori]